LDGMPQKELLTMWVPLVLKVFFQIALIKKLFSFCFSKKEVTFAIPKREVP